MSVVNTQSLCVSDFGKVALILITDGCGRILLGRRADNRSWTMPGGHVEPDESPEEAIKRETREECGIIPVSITLLRECQPEDGRPHIYLYSGLAPVQSHPSSHHDPDAECDVWEWVDVRGGMPKNIWDNLHGPVGDKNLLRQIYDIKKSDREWIPGFGFDLRPLVKFLLEQEGLIKGSTSFEESPSLRHYSHGRISGVYRFSDQAKRDEYIQNHTAIYGHLSEAKALPDSTLAIVSTFNENAQDDAEHMARKYGGVPAKVESEHLRHIGLPLHWIDDLNKMALKDVRVGPRIGQGVYDYSHRMPENLRASGHGFSLRVKDVTKEYPPHSDYPDAKYLLGEVLHQGEVVGSVYAAAHDGDLTFFNSSIDGDYRGKGIGSSLYESVMAHAYHKYGARRVVGDVHSTSASRVHRKMSAKHGIPSDYQPEDRGVMLADGSTEGFAYDGRYGPYQYRLAKNEANESEVAILLRHPDPRERAMALKLRGVTAVDVGQAVLDSHPHVWRTAMAHPLASMVAHHVLANHTRDCSGAPIHDRHDILLSHHDLSPEILKAMHWALREDAALPLSEQSARLRRVESHPNWPKGDSKAESLKKAESDGKKLSEVSSVRQIADHDKEISHPLVAPNQKDVDALREVSGQPSIAESSLPTAGSSEKVVHKYGDRFFIVKPYHGYRGSGWNELTSQALYHAAGIGHLHQQVFAAHYPDENKNHVPVIAIVTDPSATEAHSVPDVHLKKLQQPLSWLQVGAMDFLMGTYDRHGGNMMIKPDGNPLVIDNECLFGTHYLLSRGAPRMYFDAIRVHHDAQSLRQLGQWWKGVSHNVKKAWASRLHIRKDHEDVLDNQFQARVRHMDSLADLPDSHIDSWLNHGDFSQDDTNIAKALKGHEVVLGSNENGLYSTHESNSSDSGKYHIAKVKSIREELHETHSKLASLHPASIQHHVDAVRSMIDSPDFHEPLDVMLKGAESKVVYQHPQTKAKYLLKGPVDWFSERQIFRSAWNEMAHQAAYHAAGIGHLHQQVHLVNVDGTPDGHRMVIYLEPQAVSMKDVSEMPEVGDNMIQHLGSWRKIKIMDQLLGNLDRHSDNVMVRRDGSPLAIDHSRVFYTGVRDIDDFGMYSRNAKAQPETYDWFKKVEPAVTESVMKFADLLPSERKDSVVTAYLNRLEQLRDRADTHVKKSITITKALKGHEAVLNLREGFRRNYEHDLAHVKTIREGLHETHSKLASLHPESVQHHVDAVRSMIDSSDVHEPFSLTLPGVESKVIYKHPQTKNRYLFKGPVDWFTKGHYFPSAWNEMAHQAAYHAAGIGHLHQQVHLVNVDGTPDGHRMVVHLEPQAAPMKEAAANVEWYERVSQKKEEWSKVKLMDQLLGNIDRHSGNVLVFPDGSPLAIDHSRSFHNRLIDIDSLGIYSQSVTARTYDWFKKVEPAVTESVMKFADLLPSERKDSVVTAYLNRLEQLRDRADTRVKKSIAITKALKGHDVVLGNRKGVLYRRGATAFAVAPADVRKEMHETHLKLASLHPASIQHHVDAVRSMIESLDVHEPFKSRISGVEPKAIYKHPETKNKYLLKGVLDWSSRGEIFHSAWNEMAHQAAYHAAGIGHLHQQVHVVNADGTPDGHRMVVHLEPKAKTLDHAFRVPDLQGKLNSHIESWRKIKLMDQLLGNVDRHSSNIMVRPDGSPLAIDHSRSFLSSEMGMHIDDFGLTPVDVRYAFAIDPTSETYEWFQSVEPAVTKSVKEMASLLPPQKRDDVISSYTDRLKDLKRRADHSVNFMKNTSFSKALKGHDVVLGNRKGFFYRRRAPVFAVDPEDVRKEMHETHLKLASLHPASIQHHVDAVRSMIDSPDVHEPFKTRTKGVEPKVVYKHPETKKQYLFKGTLDWSPKGEIFHSAWNEMAHQAAYHAAGIGHLHQQVHLVNVDGTPDGHRVVVHLEPKVKTLDSLFKIPDWQEKLNDHIESWRKIKLMDQLLGNIDRHPGNIMVRRDGSPLAIDHSRTLYPKAWDIKGLGLYGRIMEPSPETYEWFRSVEPAVTESIVNSASLLPLHHDSEITAAYFGRLDELQHQANALTKKLRVSDIGGIKISKHISKALGNHKWVLGGDHMPFRASSEILAEEMRKELHGVHSKLTTMHPESVQHHVNAVRGMVDSKKNHDPLNYGLKGVEPKAVYQHPQTQEKYLLKGTVDWFTGGRHYPSAWNEMAHQAAYHAAGIGHLHQQVHVVSIDDTHNGYGMVIHLDPHARNLDSVLKHTPHLQEKIDNHIDSWQKIKIMDQLLGNIDRHSGNIMVRPDGSPLAIDHSRALHPNVWDIDNLGLPDEVSPETYDWFMNVEPNVTKTVVKFADHLPKKYKDGVLSAYLYRLDELQRRAGTLTKKIRKALSNHEHAISDYPPTRLVRESMVEAHSKLMAMHPESVQHHVDAVRSMIDSQDIHEPLTTKLKGVEPKIVYQHPETKNKYLMKGTADALPYMVFPSAWNEMAHQAAYHAAGIGHLHQQVHIANVDGTPDGYRLVVHMDPNVHPIRSTSFVDVKKHASSWQKIKIMDQLLGNVDRHSGNIMLRQDGSPLAIDHSRTFFPHDANVESFGMRSGDFVSLSPETYEWFRSVEPAVTDSVKRFLDLLASPHKDHVWAAYQSRKNQLLAKKR